MKRIGSVTNQLRRLEQEPAADVEKNETRDDRRITRYSRAGFGFDWNAGREGKVLWSNEEPANDETRDANQHAGGQKIGQQVERPPQAAASVKRDETFDHIDEVY